jgi:hypothetical protein
MVLGDALIDREGCSRRMSGLLPLVTSFAERRLHLGYRRAILLPALRSVLPALSFGDTNFITPQLPVKGPPRRSFPCSTRQTKISAPTVCGKGQSSVRLSIS